jgi:tetratricopeptide (TPR) repeat protein
MLTNEKYVLYEKGNALLQKNNYTGAVTYFDKALHIDPNFKDALSDKGETLIYIHKAALINQRKLINEKYVYYEKGHALLNNLGNYTGAIKYLYKALAIDPNFKGALNDKGNALNNLHEYNSAITYFNRVLATDPSDEFALNDKGWALNGLGNYTGAITYLNKALKIDPTNGDALSNKGWALNGLGNYTEAIKYLDNASALDPNNKHTWNNKG